LSLVVSDTSPIRALAHLRQVELLQILFGDIHVPPAVASELRNPPIGLPIVDIGTFGFLLVSAPRDQKRVEELLHTPRPRRVGSLSPGSGTRLSGGL